MTEAHDGPQSGFFKSYNANRAYKLTYLTMDRNEKTSILSGPSNLHH